MGLTKKAKILSKSQMKKMLAYLSVSRHPERNKAMFLLSCLAGMRAKEIACLRWEHLLDNEGLGVGNYVSITNDISKGAKGGRRIPLCTDLKEALSLYSKTVQNIYYRNQVFRNQEKKPFTAHGVVCLFKRWYMDNQFYGYSSHSGRRTFITSTARNIGFFGGSLEEVQAMAGHANISMTGSYIETNEKAKIEVVERILR